MSPCEDSRASGKTDSKRSNKPRIIQLLRSLLVPLKLDLSWRWNTETGEASVMLPCA